MIAKHLTPETSPLRHQRTISSRSAPISNLLWVRRLPNPRFLLLGGYSTSSFGQDLVLCIYDVHTHKTLFMKKILEVSDEILPEIKMAKSGPYVALAELGESNSISFYHVSDLRKRVSAYSHPTNLHSIAINKRYGHLYVSDYSPQVSVIDIAAGTKKNSISILPYGQARGLHFHNVRQKLVVAAFTAILIIDVKRNEIEHAIVANKLQTNLLYGIESIIGATSDFSYVVFKSGELEDCPSKNFLNTRFFHYLECYHVESRKVMRVEIDLNLDERLICSPSSDSVLFLDSKGKTNLLRFETLTNKRVEMNDIIAQDGLKNCLFLKNLQRKTLRFASHTHNRLELISIKH